ncbi:hypothetical protein FRB97_004481, partial [Tulasnella sp. 331]
NAPKSNPPKKPTLGPTKPNAPTKPAATATKPTIPKPSIAATEATVVITAVATTTTIGAPEAEAENEGDEDDETDHRFRKRRIESNVSRYDHDSDNEDAEGRDAQSKDGEEQPEEEEDDLSWIIEKQKSRIAQSSDGYLGLGQGAGSNVDRDADVDTSLRKFAGMGSKVSMRDSRTFVIVPREDPDSISTSQLRQDAVQASTLRASADRFRVTDTGGAAGGGDARSGLSQTPLKGKAVNVVRPPPIGVMPSQGMDDESFLDALL